MSWGKNKILISSLIFLLLLMLPLLFSGFFSNSSAGNNFFEGLGVNDWLQAFEEIDRRINGGAGYANHLDTTGYLSWRQSRIMDSYLNLYEATQNSNYLEKFIYQADLVLMHRDDYMRGGVTGVE